MRKEHDHSRQAQRNLKLATEPLLKDKDAPYPDWMVTVCFYAAVHLVDMRLAAEGKEPQDHDRRNRMVATVLEDKFPGIWTKYGTLFQHSIKARYFCLPVTHWYSKTKRVVRLLEDICSILKATPVEEPTLSAEPSSR